MRLALGLYGQVGCDVLEHVVGRADIDEVFVFTHEPGQGVADVREVAERLGIRWTLERMPLIDLTVMRIAGFELLGRPDVPVAVVLDEAVELAKRFSTDDSGRFVNGVLSALVPVLRS